MKRNIIRWLNKAPYPLKIVKPKDKILYRLYNGFNEVYTPIELNKFKVDLYGTKYRK